MTPSTLTRLAKSMIGDHDLAIYAGVGRQP
jgi:hypothetical protein